MERHIRLLTLLAGVLPVLSHDHNHHHHASDGVLPPTAPYVLPPLSADGLCAPSDRDALPPLTDHDTTACPLPIDESVGPSPRAWAPWTHQPFCAGTKYCVFTNSAFAGGHGISIIATPEAAAGQLADIISSGADGGWLGLGREEGHDSHASKKQGNRTREAITSSTRKTAGQREDDEPYALRVIPDKGLGLVATRRIPRGQVFMTDVASVLADVSFPGRVRRVDGNELLTRAIAQLPDPERVMSLATSSRPDKPSPRVEDVTRTNSFSATVGDSDWIALFAKIARMNHACRPSAFTRFSEKTLAMTAVAFRDIEEGEEITISYSDFGLTYAERQLALLTRWGFRCTCDMCSAPEAERNASDTRRQRIRTLRTEVLEHVERREFFAAAKVNEEMLALIEQEGLVPHLGEHHEVVARLLYAAVKEDVKSSANARGDMMNSGTEAGRTDLRKEALKYARMAVEEMEAFGGGDVYDSLDSVRLLVTAIEKELGQGWQGWCKDYDPKP